MSEKVREGRGAELEAENAELRARLAEAEETLRAIREGEVDAIVVTGSEGERVYSLTGVERVYRLVVETMAEAALTVTLEGTVLFCNGRFAEFVGTPMERVVGRALGEFVEAGQEGELEALLKASREGPVKERLVFRGAGGALVPAHASANLLEQPEGTSICIVATDLTAMETSMEVLRRLRESEERFRSVLEGSRDVIYRVNVQTGRYEYISPSAKEVVGYTREELMALDAKASLAMIHPEDVAGMRAELARLEVSGQGNMEYRQRAKDGEYRWLSNRMSLVRDGEGRALYRDGNIRDITERKRTEGELRDMNAVLSERVAERTVELRQRAEQLQELALQLTKAEEQERERIAGVLHDDLQQILAVQKMRVQSLMTWSEEGEAGALKEISELIDQGIEKSRDLSHELAPPMLRMSGLTAALEWLAEQMNRRYDLKVELESEGEVNPGSQASASMLYRCAQELLFNTHKHSGARRARVRVWEENGLMRVSVRDEGRGFSTEGVDLKRGKGVGFGLLSIAQRLEALGGGLEIQSARGKGCCVTMCIPSGEDERASEEKSGTSAQRVRRRSATQPELPYMGRRIRILLVDDHDMIRKGLAGLLEKEKDLEVIGQASDGHEAVKMAKKLSPDVVLMDVSMPKMDGFEATETITRTMPGVKVIGLSLHDDPGTAGRMKAAGAVTHLCKTHAPEALVDTVRRFRGA